jgi:hypothetical protein
MNLEAGMGSLMRIFLALALPLLVAAAAWAGEDAAEYLGPRPGLTLVLENKDGVRVERRAVNERGNILDIEETAFFPPKDVPQGFPPSNTSRYELIAEGPRLVQRLRGVEYVLLDYSRDTWTMPVQTHPPVEAQMRCRKGRSEVRQILGQSRMVQDVDCTFTLEDEKVEYADTYTFAKGLGLVRILGMSGEGVIGDLRLTEITGKCILFE